MRRALRGSLLACAVLATLAACREEAPAVTIRFAAFDTQVDVSLVGVTPVQSERATEAVRADFASMEREWSAWAPGPMGRTNRLLAEGKPFVAPPSLLPLLISARGFGVQSGGLFNPAIGRLVELWGFDAPVPDCKPPPSARAIARLVEADPQMDDIVVDGLMLQARNPAIKLDLGSFARGYAVDLVIAHLRELGVRDAQVQAGDQLRAIGDRSGQPWRVPIRRPSGSGVLAVLKIKGDEAVASTHANDRTFIYGGVTYHAVLDPRTGWPAREVQAVTVAHGETAAASAAAQALFVAGPERWHAVARALGVRYVLLMDSRGTIHVSPEMHARLELIDPARDPIVVSAPLESPPGPSSGALGDGAGDTGHAAVRRPGAAGG